jgi:GDPmannose 4,6-dehydratase
MAKTALITGIAGQDGSYLTEFLAAKGYEVHGVRGRAVESGAEAAAHESGDAARGFVRHTADLAEAASLRAVIELVRPDEIYNLGAQSHVKRSFEIPVHTVDVVALGTLRLLEAIRELGLPCRFYQASSSEMFGRTNPPQNEDSPFLPRSPYACAKVFAHHAAVNYRESYGLQASCGILFNHESPRRGEAFVSRKITRAVARIKLGMQGKLHLGNLDARRDWGYAGDYVRAMWLMLQQEAAGDYVIGTGEMRSVREFAELAFARAGLDWREHVVSDPDYYRPAEVDALQADCSKARRVLGWEPSVGFEELVRIMVEADMEDAARERAGLKAGAESAGR